METMQWSEQTVSSKDSPPAPTIKNHSVTHFNEYLYCFGGYDGRKNHDTLLIYSIPEDRWVRPEEIDIVAAGGNAPSHHLAANPEDTMYNNHNDMNEENPMNHHLRGVGNPNGDVEEAGSSSIANRRITIVGTPPHGRNGHSATLARDPDDDEDTARIVIIGGWLGTGPLAASDMHILDISNAGRTLRWYQPAVKGTPPGPCNMHSADFIPQLQEVFVFRGGNGREYLNDLHALSTKTLTWRKVHTTGQQPQQRANHSSTVLEETGELFIFGGWNGTKRLNDIHILDTATSNWTRPQAGGVLPHPRAGMTLTTLRGRLYLFGGSGTSSKCFQDLQILDRQEMTWLDVTQYESVPHPANSGGIGNAHGRRESPYSHHHLYKHHQQRPIENHHENMDDFMMFRFGGGYDRNSNLSMQDSDNDMDLGHSDMSRQGAFTASRADWRSREMAGRVRSTIVSAPSPANPNDELSVPAVEVHGPGPGRRAGHTATAVNQKIYVFGGSCGSEYLNDFYVLDTDPPPRVQVTDPTSLHLIERRLRHFFNDAEFSDVTFLVQGQPVYGHKMVLSIVSDPFRAMFTSGFRESESMEIEIPDCSYKAFLAVMEYIYTGARPMMVVDREANLNHIVDILELADRFFLDNLKQVCEKLLENAVNGETSDYLLQVAHKTNAIQLQAVCEHFDRNRQHR